MCLSVPGRILEKDGVDARVDVDGTTVDADLTITPDAEVGDWVLVHAGYAIEQYDPDEAVETLDMLREALGDRPDAV